MYDKAQTVGDPVPVRGILRDGTPDMEKALGALLQSSPVEVVATADKMCIRDRIKAYFIGNTNYAADQF